MRGKVVAILETRTGAHLGELVARRGGVPLLAPALSEVPILEPGMVTRLLEGWRLDPYRLVIFQTGVGTRALFTVTDSLGVSAEMVGLLARSLVVVRGPKPAGELNSRQVRIDLKAASPFTTETVLDAITAVDVGGARILVQRYGAANERLRLALEARGAAVDEIATYRWALPDDVRPLIDLLHALAASRVDAVVFTSAVQIHNLYSVAQSQGSSESLAAYLTGPVIASIGPVCTRALVELGITPTFEADPPKLGPLIAGLDAALGAPG
jgi:uroporphyrinogen-III synthase